MLKIKLIIFAMERRASSSSLALGESPDFLEFAVNQLSVDDESEFLFPISCHEDPNVDNVKVSEGHDKAEFQGLELKSQSNVGPSEQQLEENEHKSERESTTSETINSTWSIIGSDGRRRSNTDYKIHRQFNRSAKELNKGKNSAFLESDKGSLQLIDTENKKAKARFRLSKSEYESKARSFTERHNTKVGFSLEGNQGPSRQKDYWPLLRNMSYEKEKYSKRGKQNKLALYDIATNLYALKKEKNNDPATHSPYSKPVLSLAHRNCGSLWLQNSLRIKKNQLPPMDSCQKRTYSEQWVPRKSVAPSFFQKSAKKEIVKDGMAFKSVLQTLETMNLGGPNRHNLLEQSLTSIDRNKNRATLRKKALPLVKSALAFKHHSNKLS